MAVDGGRRMSQRSPIWITGPRPANIRTLQAQSLTSFRRGMSTRPRGSFLAAPTEVQRLAIRAELADAVAAPGAALAIPSVHLHEAPVLLRLVVVRVGQDRLDRTPEHRRYGLVQALRLRGVPRGAAAEAQAP